MLLAYIHGLEPDLHILTTLVCIFLPNSLPRLRRGALVVFGCGFCKEVVAATAKDAARRGRKVDARRKAEENTLMTGEWFVASIC